MRDYALFSPLCNIKAPTGSIRCLHRSIHAEANSFFNLQGGCPIKHTTYIRTHVGHVSEGLRMLHRVLMAEQTSDFCISMSRHAG